MGVGGRTREGPEGGGGESLSGEGGILHCGGGGGYYITRGLGEVGLWFGYWRSIKVGYLMSDGQLGRYTKSWSARGWRNQPCVFPIPFVNGE